MDKRSRKVAFVSHCLLNSNTKARGLVDIFPAISGPVVEACLRHGVGMVQMPCPELVLGLDRPSSDPRMYTPGFRKHCRALARETARQMAAYKKAGYKVKAVIGIKGSPSCGVLITNNENGELAGKGIFMEELAKLTNVPFIEFKRKDLAYSKKELERVLK